VKTQKLLLSNHLIPQIKSGEKRYTVRKGRRNIKLGKLMFVPAIPTKNFKPITVNVVEIRYKRLCDIIQADFPSQLHDVAEWRGKMREYYPDLKKTDTMTFVHFICK